MAIMYDWVCSMAHIFEDMADSDTDMIDCPYCEQVFSDGQSSYQIDRKTFGAKAVEIALARATRIYEADKGLYSGVAHRTMLSMPSWGVKGSTTLGIVVHRDAQGNYRHPAHPDAPVPAGFEKVDITNMNEARKVERAIDDQNQVVANDKLHRETVHRNAQMKAAEDDTKARMGDMSTKGQEFAQYAMRKAREDAAARTTRADPGNAGFEALSYDKSNRGEHRDEATDWNVKQE